MSAFRHCTVVETTGCGTSVEGLLDVSRGYEASSMTCAPHMMRKHDPDSSRGSVTSISRSKETRGDNKFPFPASPKQIRTLPPLIGRYSVDKNILMETCTRTISGVTNS